MPIVLSHGMTVSKAFYTILCSELASHGYVVFALDHHDGSCAFTTDAKGEKFYQYDTTPFAEWDVQAKVK